MVAFALRCRICDVHGVGLFVGIDGIGLATYVSVEFDFLAVYSNAVVVFDGRFRYLKLALNIEFDIAYGDIAGFFNDVSLHGVEHELHIAGNAVELDLYLHGHVGRKRNCCSFAGIGN